MRREVPAGLLLALLLAGWLAPQPALALPDKPTRENKAFLNALYDFKLYHIYKEKEIELDPAEVLREYGGAERLVERLKAMGVKAADEIVSKLQKMQVRRMDHIFERDGFKILVEIKNEVSLSHEHTLLEAVRDGYLARRAEKGVLVVWFIPPKEARKESAKLLIDFLEENGVIVISDTDWKSILRKLHTSFKERYGLDFLGKVMEWHDIPQELRAEFVGELKRSRDFSFLDFVERFKRMMGLAGGLRDFVKRNWNLFALMGGVAVKVAFDEYCRRIPPKSPEEAQLREIVGKAVDAYNVGIAAYADFKTALDFVSALRAAAEGAGIDATLGAAAAGVALLQSALSWYAQWYVSTHTTWRLCREVGGRSVCFSIKGSEGFFDSEHLVVSANGRELASFNLVRGGAYDGPPRQACLVEGLRGCIDRSAESAGVRVECRSGAPYVECTLEVEQRETAPRTATNDYGSYVLNCASTEERVYKWAWRVRVGLLGLEEVQAPERSLVSSKTLWGACTIEWRYRWWSYGGYSSPGCSSTPLRRQLLEWKLGLTPILPCSTQWQPTY